MRFIMMHRSDANFETGNVKPDPKLVATVGKMIGEMQKAGHLVDGDGLGPSLKGVRLNFVGGECNVTKGPFPLVGNNDPAGFVTVQVETLDDAVKHAKDLAKDLGDVEIDIRPVNEAWDIGMGEKPKDLKTTRYMLLHKTTPGASPAPKDTSRSVNAMKASGVYQKQATLNGKATRLRRTKATGITMRDGPFAEAKELIGGYCVVDVPSKEKALEYAKNYMECCDVEHVDVIEVA